MKTFSDRLRYARILRGMTQQTLARAAGLSQSAIASYESRQRQSSRALFKLASALKIDPVWLDTGRGSMCARDGLYDDAAPKSLHRVMEERPGETAHADGDGWPFATVTRARVNALQFKDCRVLERMIELFVQACLDEYTAANHTSTRPR